MYDKMLLLRQRMSNGIISLLGNFARGGLETPVTVGAGLPAMGVWRGCLVGVHIHCCGNGGLWFRSYSDSLFEGPKSKQKVLAPTLGASLWLGMPAIRQRFGGPPPRAIHGAGRLNRHPCRFTPQIPIEFRPSCLTGRFQIKIKSADQKTADFVIEKDVRARATATAKPCSV